MLLDYHVGSAKDEVLDAVEAIGGGSLLQRAHRVKDELGSKFGEMQSLLTHSQLDASGHATATHALNKFADHFSNVDLSKANHTQLLHDIQSESATLLGMVQVASSKQLSNAGEVSRRTLSALHHWGEEVDKIHQRIGVYRSSALKQKETQRKITSLKDDIQKSAATALLLDFDRSWWAIREKLDLYLDAAEVHNEALKTAMTALDDYTTKCSAVFADIGHAHARVLQAGKAAGAQLHNTWHAVENEVGLLAARIADSHGFVHLAGLDAASADFTTNRTAMCKQDAHGKEAALIAVDHALSQGVFTQTWKQLLEVTNEMDMLYNRFEPMGLLTPRNATLIQAVDRIVNAFTEGMDQRSNIALEAARHACGQEDAFVQTAAGEDSKRVADAVESAIKNFRESEAAKEQAMEQNVETQIEARHLVEDSLKIEKERVHELEEKVKKLQADSAAKQ